MELNLGLKLKLTTTSSVGGLVVGWTKTKLMLISTQVDVVEVGFDLGNKTIPKLETTRKTKKTST